MGEFFEGFALLREIRQSIKGCTIPFEDFMVKKPVLVVKLVHALRGKNLLCDAGPRFGRSREIWENSNGVTGNESRSPGCEVPPG